MKTPTGIHAFAYELLRTTGGEPLRIGQTGYRITLAPLPINTEHAHEECYSLDITPTGLAHATNALRTTPTPDASPARAVETTVEVQR